MTAEIFSSVAEPGLSLVDSIEALPLSLEDPSLDVRDLPPDERPLVHVGALGPIGLGGRPLAVPHRRILRKDMKGQDVVAIFRALSKWEHQHGFGAYHDKPTPLYGAGKVKRMKHFQHAHGLKADGQYGPATHRKLLPYFDRHGASMMLHFHPGGKNDQARAKVVATQVFAFHHAPRHYSQVASLRCQGYYQGIKPPGMWWYADCSGDYLWGLWVVGNTKAGPVDGWTGSMVRFGKKVSWTQAKVGDAVIYGPSISDTHHVATLISKAGNGRVITHGHEGGPFNEALDYRGDVLGYWSYFN